jgi:MSHA biogenesis protein MshP
MKRQRGFSIISAIFILVALAVLGAVMVTLSGTQHQASALIIESSRATAAAKSGIEWGAWQALQGAGCGAANSDFEMTEGVMSGFRIEVTCTESNHEERGRSITVYALAAVAERGTVGRPDYVRRTMTANFVDD